MRRKRKLYAFLTVLIILICFYNWREKINEEFLRTETCPACYGVNQCKKILKENHLSFISPSKWKLFNKFLNVKNVYYGETHARKYVLKKLGYNSELQKFDKNVCRISGSPYPCNVSQAIVSTVQEHDNDLFSTMKAYERLFKKSDALKCKHYQVVQFLYDKFMELDTSHNSLHHFITIMAINPEPVILQAFHDVLPVPFYLGSCGRVVIEEYAGQPLSYYYEEPWITRAKLAIQLLKMAFSMSENEIRIYITDPSSDNFAVDHQGIVKIIDVENVVLVDSTQENLDSALHFNEGIGCKDCFSFDYEDLCGHMKCDHNYFAICKGLLSSKPFSSSLPGGLLHSIPSFVERHIPIANLSFIIEECAMPKKTQDRSTAAQELLYHLIKLTQPEITDAKLNTELRK